MIKANEYIITVENLTKKYGHFYAVDGISFNVKAGEIFGFLGANGAGKTTAMRMLSGLIKPTSGIATVVSFDVSSESEKIKRNIGYMSQKFSLYEDLTIKENMKFYGGIYGLKINEIKERTKEILDKLKLSDQQNMLVGRLPLGWKQKLSFSVALFHRPPLVFLDEPTGGVDPITRREFWEMIYEAATHGTTVFVTTHYMDEAEYCDRVSIMVDGRIDALDTPQNLRKNLNVETMNDVFLTLARGAKRSE